VSSAIIKPLAKRFQQAVAELYVSVILNYFSTQANVKCPVMAKNTEGEREIERGRLAAMAYEQRLVNCFALHLYGTRPNCQLVA